MVVAESTTQSVIHRYHFGGSFFRVLIAERLKERMAAAGLSQSELARRVGVSQASINKLTSGGSKRGSAYLHRIARELSTTPAYLNGETDDPHGEAPDVQLSSEEQRLLEIYRALPKKDRAALKVLLERMAADESPSAWKSQRRANRG